MEILYFIASIIFLSISIYLFLLMYYGIRTKDELEKQMVMQKVRKIGYPVSIFYILYLIFVVIPKV
ncbi:hypothetical protein AGMMS50289_17220 [Betaproteobacteria bacterium]|nr:hypothetical protein AGMMS50289_17220 [Betaproteobacteria bacterium]